MAKIRNDKFILVLDKEIKAIKKEIDWNLINLRGRIKKVKNELYARKDFHEELSDKGEFKRLASSTDALITKLTTLSQNMEQYKSLLRA